MTKYTIGIDGGGSKTHAILIDANKQIIDETITEPANITTDLNLATASITTAIQSLINKNNLSVANTAVGIGVAGFSNIENRKTLLTNLQQSYPNITLASDCHIACLAAHDGHDGAILICGTGVVGYYIKDRVGHQIGGWGFPHGDLGGGAWLGLELCKSLCKAIDGSIGFSPILDEIFLRFANDANKYKNWFLTATPGDYAEIARLIPGFIKKNDQAAQHVFSNGCNEIEIFLTAILKKIGNLPIKITGGLAKFYLTVLNHKFPTLEISTKSNALGACYLCLSPLIADLTPIT